MILDIFEFEKFLKYGFAGLVAIFALLLYSLFKGQMKGELSTKDFLMRILPFLGVTILLLIMAGYSIYTDRQFQKDTAAYTYKQTTDSASVRFQQRIDSLTTRLSFCEGSSPAVESAKSRYEAIKHVEDSLQRIIVLLQKEVKQRSDYLNTSVILDIANSLEAITLNTSSKGFDSGRQPELTEKIMRNAVFQNMLSFGADTAILRPALLVMQHRGYKVNVNKMLSQLPFMIASKRRWLSTVIAQLTDATQNLGPVQSNANIKVELPKEFWILETPYTISFVDNQMPALQLEKQLLDKKTL